MEESKKEIPKGLCQCGCGGRTRIAYKNIPKAGWVRGEPIKYINGHYRHKNLSSIMPPKKGKDNPSWNGGRTVHSQGYILIRQPDHPRAHNGYVYEHILIAEKVLGKPLPSGAQVHHINGDKSDNSHGNHVICQDQSYHNLIEQRIRAYMACGHAGWFYCRFCGKYDDPINMHVVPNHNYGYHRSCYNFHRRNKGSIKNENK